MTEVSPWTNPQEWGVAEKGLRCGVTLPSAGLDPNARIDLRDKQAVARISAHRTAEQLPIHIGKWPIVDAITEVILHPSPGTVADAWEFACLRGGYKPDSTISDYPTACAQFIHVWNEISELALQRSG